MVRSLARARRITRGIIAKGKYQRIISDCRYDVYDTIENSYFINHQVRFHSNRMVEQVSDRWLARAQKRYKRVLVPDYPADHFGSGMTGRLSHGTMVKHCEYIGVLSMLEKKKMRKDVDVFVSISGPEPQRSILEKIVLPQARRLARRKRVVVTLGKPEEKKIERTGKLTVHSFLNREEQERMMNRASVIVTRSGYTTMMELYELDVSRAILIPTPGQSEQVYLAEYYDAQGWYPHVEQHKLDLARDIRRLEEYTGFPKQWKTKESVRKFLKIVGV
jgi:UDP-N-acetylglucosamine transferase subunit ALG13